jgi:hypothetical protein
VNLPEHAGNVIHTDEGARAAGFDAALIAGVTVYAYLTHPVAAAWGLDWVRSGGAHVSFQTPVLDGEVVDCVPVVPEEPRSGPAGASWEIQARVGDEIRARSTMWRGMPTDDRREARMVEQLESLSVPLSGEWEGYGARAGDDLELYASEGIVDPAVWPALANTITRVNLVRGPWIHTRSLIRHHGLGRLGSIATVEGVVIDRFTTRAGERAVLDISIHADGELLASLEHEAIIALA